MKQISAKWWILLAYLILIAFCIFAGGCNVAEKAVDKYKASKQFPKDCAIAFPPKIITGKTDTVTIESATIDCDSIESAYQAYWAAKKVNDTVTIIQPSKVVKCPPATIITRVDTFVNMAELEAQKRYNYELQDIVLKTIAEREDWKAKFEKENKDKRQYRSFMWWIIVVVGMFIGGFIWAKTR